MAHAILQARMSSSRLPGKVLRPVLGEPMIGRQVERLRRARRLDGLTIATSTDASDDVIAAYARRIGVDCFRGPLDDVLARFIGALEAAGNPRTFVRLTADCPLADWRLVDRCIEAHQAADADYTYNSLNWTFPKGLDVEVCATAALMRAAAEGLTPYDREHVTPFIYGHPELFRLEAVTRDPPLRYRWTVDTPEDFAFVTAVYEALYPANPAFTSEDVLDWQASHPDQVLPNQVT
ncbi:MAG TPA: glycosyltransferase family protein [Caulobacteraceae bacterium]|jgi:spore coat polysaccharide biosynthesis protein SpsF|nr:glycosyltransferase family protein [Caulobacteraceae bacterium]